MAIGVHTFTDETPENRTAFHFTSWLSLLASPLILDPALPLCDITSCILSRVDTPFSFFLCLCHCTFVRPPFPIHDGLCPLVYIQFNAHLGFRRPFHLHGGDEDGPIELVKDCPVITDERYLETDARAYFDG